MVRYLVLILVFVLAPLYQPSVSQAREMEIVYAQSFEPFSWRDEGGQARGILIDFLDETLGKRMGIKLKHEVCPWARCQLMVKLGEKDAFFTIPNASRRLYTLVSDLPLFQSNFVLYTGVGNTNIPRLRTAKTLSELKLLYGLTHISITGAGWHRVNLKGVKKRLEVVDSTRILEMLKQHRADVYIEQQALVQYQANKLGMSQFILEIPNVMDATKWHLCIGRQSSFAEIMPEFNELLRSMDADGSLDALREEIFSRYR